MRDQNRIPRNCIPPVRLVAFYLPQFHPIPENDLWWGKGFTEWDNVRGAKPLYAGHTQPNAPHPLLGWYDLRDISVMRRQVRLARQHGIFGFCFHHYWFEGKRLLERPLEAFLGGADDPELRFPFCLNWANHDWARTWTGDPAILQEQRHNPEDDIAFMRDALRHFRDPRYIRIRGRPLLLIFRADSFADLRATRERWKQICAEHGETQPYCAMLQTYRNDDPRLFHMDAAVQFPPHAPWLPDNKYPLRAVSEPVPGFHGYVVDYEDLACLHLGRLNADFTLFPGLVPAWDNSPRRGVKASIFAGGSPEKYARWLAKACEYALRHGPEERLVFVNAWNEWGESACLEPDVRNGFAYLNATSAVLQKLAARDAAGSSRPLSAREPCVLVIDILPPEYDRHAGGRASWQFALQLKAAGCRVAFTCLRRREGAERYFADLRAHGIEVIEPARHEGSAEDWLRAGSVSFDLALLHRPAVAGRLLGLIREECKKPVIYFGHDLLFLRQEREAAAGGRPLPADAARRKEQELAAYRKATIAMTPSHAEAALLREQHAVSSPVFVPQLLSYPKPALGPLDASKRRGVLFVGSAAHSANLDGLRWFLSAVRPLLARRVPDCPLHIAGFGMRPELFEALPGNCMLYDAIPDSELEALYGGSLVCIAPLRFGAGMKGKLLEAMFHGLPLVGTSIAYEGLPELPAAPADTEEGFADAIAALLRDGALWQTASLRSRTLIAEHFSEERAVRFWREMVEMALCR